MTGEARLLELTAPHIFNTQWWDRHKLLAGILKSPGHCYDKR